MWWKVLAFVGLLSSGAAAQQQPPPPTMPMRMIPDTRGVKIVWTPASVLADLHQAYLESERESLETFRCVYGTRYEEVLVVAEVLPPLRYILRSDSTVFGDCFLTPYLIGTAHTHILSNIGPSPLDYDMLRFTDVALIITVSEPRKMFIDTREWQWIIEWAPENEKGPEP